MCLFRIDTKTVVDIPRPEDEVARADGSLLVAEPERQLPLHDVPGLVLVGVPVTRRPGTPRCPNLRHGQATTGLAARRLVGDEGIREPERLALVGPEHVGVRRQVEAHRVSASLFDSAVVLSCPSVWRIASRSSRQRLVGTSTIRAQVGIHLTS